MKQSKTTTEKLQKVIANSGVASRRSAERWIAAGRVSVNGNLASIGERVSAQDAICIDGKPLAAPADSRRVILYNKPEGEICTRSDAQGRPTVYAALPALKQGRWMSVGRLDINTSGLLLFSTDGELVHRLQHPSYEIERLYAVRVLGQVSDNTMKRLLTGVQLEDGKAKFESIKWVGGRGANQWYHVMLREGRKREVRRLFESQDLQVSRLMRIAYAKIRLPKGLPQGHWQALSGQELAALLASVGL